MAEKVAGEYSVWIDGVIDWLSRSVASEHTFNQYEVSGHVGTEGANSVRRENLRRYLRQMAEIGPRAMLVGEAPGYRGCRLTGVPFTSERILLSSMCVQGSRGPRQIFGIENGYRKTTERKRVTGEASATIVWQTISELRPLPLLWNAYPFHTFRKNQPMSNRRPSAPELTSGGELISEFLNSYAIDTVVAVGESAAHALNTAGISFHKVRHPSHGGKSQFIAGLRHIADETGAFLPLLAR